MSHTLKDRKRAAVITLGCRLNQAESALLEGRLHEAGYTIVPYFERADLGIINTCTVTGEADAKSRKLIRAFIRRNPGAVVAVVGCMSELHAAQVAKIAGVDVVMGNANKLDVLEHVGPEKNAEAAILCNELSDGDFTIDCGAGDAPRLETRANLKIQEGCDCMCAYCVVPLARGNPRSREMPNLLEEARALAAAGVKEVVLTGINVGAYGWRGSTIVDVVDELDKLGFPRVRISSIELTTIPGGLLERMNDPAHALVPFLHVPLQSGCDRTLEAMGRPYTAGEFRAFLEKARCAVAGLCIGADVMVGFPGETDADFAQSMLFVSESPIDYAHVFKYSARPKTRAARMPGRVPPWMSSTRSACMRLIAVNKRAMFHARHEGETHEVLFEQKIGGQWLGYTGNYIRVAVESELELENELVPVKLTGSRDETMTGVLVR